MDMQQKKEKQQLEPKNIAIDDGSYKLQYNDDKP
jgi:hypothetical protein